MKVPIKYWRGLDKKFFEELLPAMKELGLFRHECLWELDYIIPNLDQIMLGANCETELEEKSIIANMVATFGNNRFKVKCRLSDDGSEPYWCLEFRWWEENIQKSWHTTSSCMSEIKNFIKTI